MIFDFHDNVVIVDGYRKLVINRCIMPLVTMRCTIDIAANMIIYCCVLFPFDLSGSYCYHGVIGRGDMRICRLYISMVCTVSAFTMYSSDNHFIIPAIMLMGF